MHPPSSQSPALDALIMTQDGQSTSRHGRPNDGWGLLQVVLLSYDSKGERQKNGDQHAAIRFPASYEDAMATIKQSLGQYLKGGPTMIDAVELLCPMLDMDDEWAWAKADKKDWDLIIEEVERTRKTLGIRQPKDVGFTRGPVVLAYGEPHLGLTQWTSTPSADESKKWPRPGYATIDRPRSYKEAVAVVIGAAASINIPYLPPVYLGIKEARDLAQVEFRFYSFITNKDGVPTTDAWIEFPAAAYEDEKIWRAVVPEHHQILGFTLHPKGRAILGFDL
ncbi:hypothetical protein BJ912DRAFT_128573 [Pholiota molesta]|nr:hypothetical protein BJ912DRAFT_128573 [Pholiota molesta]